MQAKSFRLTLLQGRLAVCRLAAEEPIPDWVWGKGFVSVTRTPEELSLVCPEGCLPADTAGRVERGFRAFRVEGPLDFGLSGVLASLLDPLARERIPVFVISTFDTDYLLVREDQTDRAAEALSGVAEICGGEP
jgi:hypothetical protein